MCLVRHMKHETIFIIFRPTFTLHPAEYKITQRRSDS